MQFRGAAKNVAVTNTMAIHKKWTCSIWIHWALGRLRWTGWMWRVHSCAICSFDIRISNGLSNILSLYMLHFVILLHKNCRVDTFDTAASHPRIVAAGSGVSGVACPSNDVSTEASPLHMNRYRSAIECISRTQQFLFVILNNKRYWTLATSTRMEQFPSWINTLFSAERMLHVPIFGIMITCVGCDGDGVSGALLDCFAKYWLGLNRAHDAEQPVAIVSVRRSYSPMTSVCVWVGRTMREVSVCPPCLCCSTDVRYSHGIEWARAYLTILTRFNLVLWPHH